MPRVRTVVAPKSDRTQTHVRRFDASQDVGHGARGHGAAASVVVGGGRRGVLSGGRSPAQPQRSGLEQLCQGRQGLGAHDVECVVDDVIRYAIARGTAPVDLSVNALEHPSDEGREWPAVHRH